MIFNAVGMVMNLTSMGYSFKQSIKNMSKNRLMTIASVSTMVACLFILGLFYSMAINFQYTVHHLENELGITILFEENITYEQINQIKGKIKLRPEIKTIKYISAEEAWQSFVNKYKNKEDILKGFQGDNPLKDSASFEVHLKDMTEQNEFVKYAEVIPGVRKVNYEQKVADVLKTVNNFIAYVSLVIIGILLFISLFLMNNTVRVGIAVRREEIKIMKLIGATDAFIRGPFILEGIMIGITGASIPLLIIFFSYNTVIKYINNNFNIIQGFIQYVPRVEVFQILVPLSFLIGIGIGCIGSAWTLRKHLRV